MNRSRPSVQFSLPIAPGGVFPLGTFVEQPEQVELVLGHDFTIVNQWVDGEGEWTTGFTILDVQGKPIWSHPTQALNDGILEFRHRFESSLSHFTDFVKVQLADGHPEIVYAVLYIEGERVLRYPLRIHDR